MVFPLAVLCDKVERTQVFPGSLISISHDLINQTAVFVQFDDVVSIVSNTFKCSVVAVFLLCDFHVNAPCVKYFHRESDLIIGSKNKKTIRTNP